ncbi:OmpA family protein [Thermodesulfobacteriota bacterium B35]
MSSVLLLWTTASIATGQVYEIRQEEYTFRMPVTRTVREDTFVIVKARKDAIMTAPGNDSKNAVQKNSTYVVCHFALDSAKLTAEEKEKTERLLAHLPPKSSGRLLVTGYTCPLGPEQHNWTLSLQRARAVAAFLRSHGYQVAAVRGKGSQDPVTVDPGQYRLNRRVTVQVVAR